MSSFIRSDPHGRAQIEQRQQEFRRFLVEKSNRRFGTSIASFPGTIFNAILDDRKGNAIILSNLLLFLKKQISQV